MEKVEKKLTRIRATLKSRRKLSLPVFLHQFQQQWAAEHGSGSSSESLRNSTETIDYSKLSVYDNQPHLSSTNNKFGSLSSIPTSIDKELHPSLDELSNRNNENSSISSILGRISPIESSSKRRNSKPSIKSKRNYSTLPNSSFSSVSSSSSTSSGSGYNLKLPLKSNGSYQVSHQQYYVNPLHHHLVATVSSPGGTTSTTLILPQSDELGK